MPLGRTRIWPQPTPPNAPRESGSKREQNNPQNFIVAASFLRYTSTPLNGGFTAMDLLELVRLSPLMSRSQGRRDIAVALIDGPVALDHPDLAQATIKEIPADIGGSCSRLESVACMHGTFVAGMLVARRGSPAPAICPGCTLILRPIFPRTPR